MARTKVKKAAEAVNEPEAVPSIFDHFNLETPGGLKSNKETPASGPSQAELLARLDAMQAKLDAVSQAPLPQAPAYYQAPQAAATHQVDLANFKVSHEGLPDPIKDQAAYDRMLAERMNAALDARTHALRQEMQQTQSTAAQSSQLWENFQGAHPEWSEYPDLVGSVAQTVAQRAEAAGVDVKKYMYGQSQRFFADVTKELNAKYGALVAKAEGEEEPEGKSGAKVEDDMDDGRSLHTLGGLESGNRPAGKPSKGSDMIEDIVALQRASGFF